MEGRIARLNVPGLSALVDAAQPAEGLSSIAIGGAAWQGARLLGVSSSVLANAAISLADWHTRASALVAVYETCQPDAARFDICWQIELPAEGDPWLARVDLLVSIRTDCLDWRHDVYLESDLPCATEVKLEGEASTNMRGSHLFMLDCWSYAELIHPADLRCDETGGTSLSPAKGVPFPGLLRGGAQPSTNQKAARPSQDSGTCHQRHQLFQPESLEKGVILRARARGLFLPAAIEPSAVARSYVEFAAADPPLE